MTLWRGDEGNTYEVDLDYLKLQSRFVEISELIRRVGIIARSPHNKEFQLWFSYICNTAKAIEEELLARKVLTE